MLEGYDNKAIGNKDFKRGAPLHAKGGDEKKEKLATMLSGRKKKFFFPGRGVVKAESLEDATLKLNYQKKSNRKN